MTIHSIRMIHALEDGFLILLIICCAIVLVCFSALFLTNVKYKRVLVWCWWGAIILPIICLVAINLHTNHHRSGLLIPAETLFLIPDEKITARMVIELDRAPGHLIYGGAAGGILPAYVDMRSISGLGSHAPPPSGSDCVRIWLINAEIDCLHLGLSKKAIIYLRPGQGLWIGEIKGITIADLETVFVGGYPEQSP